MANLTIERIRINAFRNTVIDIANNANPTNTKRDRLEKALVRSTRAEHTIICPTVSNPAGLHHSR